MFDTRGYTWSCTNQFTMVSVSMIFQYMLRSVYTGIVYLEVLTSVLAITRSTKPCKYLMDSCGSRRFIYNDWLSPSGLLFVTYYVTYVLYVLLTKDRVFL